MECQHCGGPHAHPIRLLPRDPSDEERREVVCPLCRGLIQNEIDSGTASGEPSRWRYIINEADE